MLTFWYSSPLANVKINNIEGECIGERSNIGVCFCSFNVCGFFVGNCKHLQFVSGVNFVIYWLAIAVWDFLCYMISCLLVLLSLYVSA